MFRSSPQRQATNPANISVIVYGTDWCASTQMVRRYLDRMGIPYTYRNMDNDQLAENQVRWWTGGYANHPTIQVGGEILIEPSMSELESELAEAGLI